MKAELINKLRAYFNKNLSIREIARLLKIPKTSVHRWVLNIKALETENLNAWYTQVVEQGLSQKLRELLLFRTQEKGKTRVLSFAQIRRIFLEEAKKRGLNMECNSFVWQAMVDFFVKKEFGSWERLEMLRRETKELAKFKENKGALQREVAWWEVDVTGYTYQDKQYSVLQAMDRLTCFVFPPFIVENKEKKVTYYNKAFNALDVAEYLKRLFLTFGLPQRIITDNEAILKAELVTTGLNKLGVEIQRTRPHNPHQKLLERTFRSLKDLAREVIATSSSPVHFEEIWLEATRRFNLRPHTTKHLGTIVPYEVAKIYGVCMREPQPEELNLAFAEKFERVVSNDREIRIANLIYELPTIYAGKVICYRPINSLEELLVYDENHEYLGKAKLITKALAPSPREEKQITQQLKRVERRIKKIDEEKEELWQVKVQITGKEEINAPLIHIEVFASDLEVKALEKQENFKLNVLDIFNEEGSHDSCLSDSKKVH